MANAFLGTTNGVFRLHDGTLEPLGLDGHSVTALHASDDALLAGSYGDGLFRSGDGGRTWERIEAGLTASTFRFVTAELAGTEPARVYRSSDGGRSWKLPRYRRCRSRRAAAQRRWRRHVGLRARRG